MATEAFIQDYDILFKDTYDIDHMSLIGFMKKHKRFIEYMNDVTIDDMYNSQKCTMFLRDTRRFIQRAIEIEKQKEA